MPLSITFCAAQPVNAPTPITTPPRLSMNGGVNGSSRAFHFLPFMKKPALKQRSTNFVLNDRFEQPRWSKRYTVFSAFTSTAFGTSFAKSGNDSRIASAFVTTPDTPKPVSSARS